jgi:hypothetical protein
MQSVFFPARQARSHYRHELRTLTYVTLDEANGGIVRNLNHEGVAVQAVGPLRQQQRVRLRFELRFPRLRVETYGQVAWASSSGHCGIRFVDLPEPTGHQIDKWIFSNLLDAIAREAAHPRPIFGASVVSIVREENGDDDDAQNDEQNDGLTLSAPPRRAIRLEPRLAGRGQPQALHEHSEKEPLNAVASPVHHPSAHDPSHYHPSQHDASAQLSWLSRPLSGRTLAWLVDSLVVIAALLLFALIFLSIAHELPRWRLALGAASAAAVLVTAAYWTLFTVFGGTSPGARLAQAAYILEEEQEADGASRFR